jgi:hypothetical protein
MTDVGIILTITFVLAVFVLPRRYAVLTYIAAVLYITQGQALDFGGINFISIRFIEIAAAIRILVRREISALQLKPPDKWIILFFFIFLGINLIREGALSMYMLGLAVDAWLVYFTFRALIPTPEDLMYFMKGMVLLLVPFALLMVVESIKGHNLFSVMGGVPETPVFREGYYRCQGSFRHAITAGTVGATFLPIFIGFLFNRSYRLWSIIGVTACLAIVITSHSSGPLMTTIVVFAGWCCWPLRNHLKWVRRGIAAAVLVLHFMMKAPVWFIFDRISGYIGGDGWHRANLIDKFIKNFAEWWLVGMPIEKTVNWAATVTKFGAVDVTNYYVSVGISGGMISLIIFIIMLTYFFKIIGLGLNSIRNNSTKNDNFEPILWSLGVAVLAHVVNISAVQYFDQSYVIWYLHLALAVTFGSYFIQNRPDSDVVMDIDK